MSPTAKFIHVAMSHWCPAVPGVWEHSRFSNFCVLFCFAMRRVPCACSFGRQSSAQKDSEKTSRLPMPTALMAATASAKRAEPPPMVVKTQKASQDALKKYFCRQLIYQTFEEFYLNKFLCPWGVARSFGFARTFFGYGAWLTLGASISSSASIASTWCILERSNTRGWKAEGPKSHLNESLRFGTVELSTVSKEYQIYIPKCTKLLYNVLYKYMYIYIYWTYLQLIHTLCIFIYVHM